jgi:hypothetical protein
LQRNDAEQVQRVCVLRLELQYRSIAAFRVGQATGSMLAERERESFIRGELRHSFCSIRARRGGTR